jgi:deoxyribodipyrimidine photo-lyase
LLSIRELHRECLKKADVLDAKGRGSVMKYIAELVWREFYMQISGITPRFWSRNSIRNIEAWFGLENSANLQRWQDGETGFPIRGCRNARTPRDWFHAQPHPDDCRDVSHEGPSFSDWRYGEAYFMRTLTDGEIASNNGGWQWSAGTGADAAPYFRIQNPWSQTKRFDPEGTYIKRWIPELRDVAPEKFQDPPAPGLRLAKGYPAPIVDHAAARDITLDLFKATQP